MNKFTKLLLLALCMYWASCRDPISPYKVTIKSEAGEDYYSATVIDTTHAYLWFKGSRYGSNYRCGCDDDTVSPSIWRTCVAGASISYSKLPSLEIQQRERAEENHKYLIQLTSLLLIVMGILLLKLYKHQKKNKHAKE